MPSRSRETEAHVVDCLTRRDEFGNRCMSTPRLRRRRNPGELRAQRGSAVSIVSETARRPGRAARPRLVASGPPMVQTTRVHGRDLRRRLHAVLHRRRDCLSVVLEPQILDSHRPASGRFRADRGRQEVVAEHALPAWKAASFTRSFAPMPEAIGPGSGPCPRRMRIASHSSAIRSRKGCRSSASRPSVSRLEKLLARADGSRAVVCENYGVSATDLLEYWHRVHHDVLATDPPDMIVLCIYPGNDFQGALPDDAFDGSDKPLNVPFPQAGMGPARDRVGESTFQVRLLRAPRHAQHGQPARFAGGPSAQKLVGRSCRSSTVGRGDGSAAVAVYHPRHRRGMPRETRQGSASWSSGRSRIMRL